MAKKKYDKTIDMDFDNKKTVRGSYTKSNPKIEKSCGVIVFRDCERSREFILLKYPEGHWDLPKGHVEKGESEKKTARREFTEETGINELEVFEGFREHITYTFYAAFPNLKGWIQKTVVFFVGRTSSCDEAQLSHEHHDFLWLPENEALEKLTYDNVKEIFKSALNFLRTKPLR